MNLEQKSLPKNWAEISVTVHEVNLKYHKGSKEIKYVNQTIQTAK